MAEGWTEDQMATLRLMADEGLSAGDAAKKLGKSRNACIGKGHRLGFVFCSQAGRLPSRLSAPRAPNHAQRPTRPRAVAPSYTSPSAKTEAGGRTVAAVVSLCHNACKWPIGDPTHDDFRFCGEPALRTYCAAHAEIGVTKTRAPNIEKMARYFSRYDGVASRRAAT